MRPAVAVMADRRGHHPKKVFLGTMRPAVAVMADRRGHHPKKVFLGTPGECPIRFPRRWRCSAPIRSRAHPGECPIRFPRRWRCSAPIRSRAHPGECPIRFPRCLRLPSIPTNDVGRVAQVCTLPDVCAYPAFQRTMLAALPRFVRCLMFAPTQHSNEPPSVPHHAVGRPQRTEEALARSTRHRCRITPSAGHNAPRKRLREAPAIGAASRRRPNAVIDGGVGRRRRSAPDM